MLRSGKRYMSNITISADAAELGALPADTLATRLRDHTRNGIFTGTYAGPGRGRLEADFEAGLARLYRRADTPRLSGVQIKAPMFLARDGRLSPSAGLPFTHILKPAGTSGFQALSVIEYLAMSLAGATGLAVPAIALVPMPDAMPPPCWSNGSTSAHRPATPAALRSRICVRFSTCRLTPNTTAPSNGSPAPSGPCQPRRRRICCCS